MPFLSTTISPSFASLRVDRPLRSAGVAADAGLAFLPSGAAAYQVPPTPWPLASPGLVSMAYRYMGQPATVSCFVPSAAVTEPSSEESTPAAASAPLAGTAGQVFRQASSQFDL